MKRIRRLVTVTAIVLALVPVALELALRVALSAIPPASAAAVTTLPQAYASEPYNVVEFLAERQHVLDTYAIDDDAFYHHADYHGKYITIVNNRRATPGQPIAAKHMLWIFGASQVYGLETPDDYTIPAYLQKLMPAYRVENAGMPSVPISKEFILLKQTPIKPGDIVVMYDGLIDGNSPYAISQNRKRLEPSLCHTLLDHLSWSMFMRVACSGVDDVPSAPDMTLVYDAYRSYNKTVIQAHDWTIAHGAAFYHILQATIYAPAPTGYEIALADHIDTYRESWPLLQQTPYTIDLQHALDDVRAQPIWFNETHTNSIGNAAIARAIAGALWRTF